MTRTHALLRGGFDGNLAALPEGAHVYLRRLWPRCIVVPFSHFCFFYPTYFPRARGQSYVCRLTNMANLMYCSLHIPAKTVHASRYPYIMADQRKWLLKTQALQFPTNRVERLTGNCAPWPDTECFPPAFYWIYGATFSPNQIRVCLKVTEIDRGSTWCREHVSTPY